MNLPLTRTKVITSKRHYVGNPQPLSLESLRVTAGAAASSVVTIFRETVLGFCLPHLYKVLNTVSFDSQTQVMRENNSLTL
jgi:hypothetical protein